MPTYADARLECNPVALSPPPSPPSLPQRFPVVMTRLLRCKDRWRKARVILQGSGKGSQARGEHTLVQGAAVRGRAVNTCY